MKKLYSIIACGALIFSCTAQADAALLENWTYTLSDVKLNNLDSSMGTIYTGAYSKKEGLTYLSGAYYHSIEPKHPDGKFTGEFNFSSNFSSTGDPRDPDDFLRYDTSVAGSTTERDNKKLADLSFSYTVASVGGEISTKLTYSIPLFSHYDPSSNTSYVYYNTADVNTTGNGTMFYGSDLYIVLGVNLSVDGYPINTSKYNGSDYAYWAINEDTRTSDASDKTKTWTGSYNITSSLSMLTYPLTPSPTTDKGFEILQTENPTPTPEPATMLLTGLGLAGVGLLKRSRKK